MQNDLRPIDLTPTASGYLDAMRSLAAVAVMLNHLRGLFFEDYAHVAASNTSSGVKLIYSLTGFGHQSVMAFFVLSGFLISSSVLRKVQSARWSWRDYAIDRGVRLYLVLAPCLVLGGVLDLAGFHFFNQNGIYSNPLPAFGDAAPIQHLNLLSFAGSLLFLQTRFTTVFGSNGPLWSLFNEFWYYVIFPALIWIVLSLKRRSFMVVVYLFIAGVAAWVLGGAISGFAVWLAGGCASVTSRRFPLSRIHRSFPAIYVAGFLLVTAACLWSARTNRGPLGSDFALGLAFAFLTNGVVQLQAPLGAFLGAVAKDLAGFSYSLYLLHFPLLLLLRAALLPAVRWQPNGIHLLMAAGVAAFVIFYAYAVASVTERKTYEVRCWLRRHVGQEPRSMPAITVKDEA